MFAVRQKSTGWFIPAISSRHRNGGTRLEPTADCAPRMFRTPGHALLFLRQWIRGKLIVSKHDDIYFGEDESWEWEATPHRNWNDMEIVEIRIESIQCHDLPPMSSTKQIQAAVVGQPSISSLATSVLPLSMLGKSPP